MKRRKDFGRFIVRAFCLVFFVYIDDRAFTMSVDVSAGEV